MIDRDTGTRIGRRLYLGWDVGGWMGKTDCFAAYVLGHGGSLMRRIQGQSFSLMKDFGEKKWTLENFARLLDPQIMMDRFDRVVLGIHAPLGLPARYLKSVQSGFANVPAPEYGLTQLLDAATLHPDYPDAHAFLAVVFARTGLRDQAIRELELLDALDPPAFVRDLVANLRTELTAAVTTTTTTPG